MVFCMGNLSEIEKRVRCISAVKMAMMRAE